MSWMLWCKGTKNKANHNLAQTLQTYDELDCPFLKKVDSVWYVN